MAFHFKQPHLYAPHSKLTERPGQEISDYICKKRYSFLTRTVTWLLLRAKEPVASIQFCWRDVFIIKTSDAIERHNCHNPRNEDGAVFFFLLYFFL